MVLIALGVASCTVKNEQYYRSNPKELQAALTLCANQHAQDAQCSKLQQLGQRMGTLAYQLQSSPQGFGTKILSLQEAIAAQEHAIKGNHLTAEEQNTLAHNKEDLADRLAVVKWLESPAS